MDFRGAAKRRTDQDLADALKIIPDVELAALQAVMDVESPESGFVGGRPSVLFERHIFWRELGPGAKRDLAASKGLAYQKWRTRPYPKNTVGVYAEIEAACQIDETAALRSTSWGLGQIMGSEHLEAGYQSPQQMVTAFCAGEREQIFGMVHLIKARHLDRSLRDHDWANFALHYNGTGYRQNHYDERLAAAYDRRLKGKGPANWTALQEDLATLGLYQGKIDGAFGPITRSAVIAFQTAHGLTPNGVPSIETATAIREAAGAVRMPPAPVTQPKAQTAPAANPGAPVGHPAPKPAPHVEAGAIGAGGALVGRAFSLPPFEAVCLGVAIAAAILIAFHLLSRRKKG